jgi:hypothetical protein
MILYSKTQNTLLRTPRHHKQHQQYGRIPPFKKAPKSYNGEKTASSTNVPRKSGYLPAEN